jgi:protein SCO1/2
MLPRLLLCLALALTACKRAPAPSSVIYPPVAYEVRGIVRKVEADKHRAVIAHEAIPDYMDAMAMEFEVPGAEDMAALQPGATIAFRLSVTDTRSWVDQVRRIAEPVSVPAEAPVPDILAVGAQAPDCALVDQTGRAFHLRDFRGRVLAITFIFTRCPLPDFCPRMSEHFDAVQSALPADQTDWHLLSVSFDPAYDTPERLAAYATRYRANAARWTFATGDVDEVEKLGNAFGLRIFREGTELNHTLRTVVIDRQGRVQKIFTGNEWKPPDLIDEINRALAAKPN